MKSNKGITMVALVVTIVIILILAGVSLSMVLGDNGIFKNATQARDDTNIGNEKTALATAFASIVGNKFNAQTDDIPDNLLEYISVEDIEENLPGYTNISMSEPNDDEEVTITFTNTEKKTYEAIVNKHLAIKNIERK